MSLPARALPAAKPRIEVVPAAFPGGEAEGRREEAVLRADCLALALKTAVDRIVVPLSAAAQAFVDRRSWIPFGHARLDDHARERFGRSGRWVRDLATLGRGLQSLPGFSEALTGEDGGPPIGRVAASLVSRVASKESVAAWIALARTVTVRDLRRAVGEARAAGSDWPPERAAERDGTHGVSPDEPESGGAEEYRLVRVPVPAPVRAAFDETLDLHRAVCGYEATVTSFVEALVAESVAAGRPPDVDTVASRPGPSESTVEAILARSTGNWGRLKERGAGSPEKPVAARQAAKALERLRDCAIRAGQGDAVDLDGQIRGLIALEDELMLALGRLLAEMGEAGAWSRLMFGGVGHYAEERLGLGRTASEDRARVARAMRRFPLVRRAYEDGTLGFERARLVVRILGPGVVGEETERLWVERATGCTIKRLRDEKRALERRRLASPRIGAARPMDDRDWHASLRRDPGTTARRLERLGKDAARWRHPDVFLGLRLPEEIARPFVACMEDRRRALRALVEAVEWDRPWPEPDPPSSVAAARMFSTRCRRIPAWVGLLAMLEDYVATWDDPRGMPKRESEEIYRRDGWRCTAPGCTSRRNLEDHHVKRRSRGGGNERANRTCVCRFHHQMGVHGRLAECAGRAPTGIRWSLGRGGIAGRFRNERKTEEQELPTRP